MGKKKGARNARPPTRNKNVDKTDDSKSIELDGLHSAEDESVQELIDEVRSKLGKFNCCLMKSN